MIYLNKYNSILGPITMLSDGSYIIKLWIEGQKHNFQDDFCKKN